MEQELEWNEYIRKVKCGRIDYNRYLTEANDFDSTKYEPIIFNVLNPSTKEKN